MDPLHDELGRFRKGGPGGPGRRPKKIVPVDLRIHEGPLEEVLARICAAVDSRELTLRDGKAAIDLLKGRIEIIETKRLEADLEAIRRQLAAKQPQPKQP